MNFRLQTVTAQCTHSEHNYATDNISLGAVLVCGDVSVTK